MITEGNYIIFPTEISKNIEINEHEQYVFENLDIDKKSLDSLLEKFACIPLRVVWADSDGDFKISTRYETFPSEIATIVSKPFSQG